jgi:hypothetical protein
VDLVVPLNRLFDLLVLILRHRVEPVLDHDLFKDEEKGLL